MANGLLLGPNHPIFGDPAILGMTMQVRLYDCPAVGMPASCLIVTLKEPIESKCNIQTVSHNSFNHKIQATCCNTTGYVSNLYMCTIDLQHFCVHDMHRLKETNHSSGYFWWNIQRRNRTMKGFIFRIVVNLYWSAVIFSGWNIPRHQVLNFIPNMVTKCSSILFLWLYSFIGPEKPSNVTPNFKNVLGEHAPNPP